MLLGNCTTIGAYDGLIKHVSKRGAFNAWAAFAIQHVCNHQLRLMSSQLLLLTSLVLSVGGHLAPIFLGEVGWRRAVQQTTTFRAKTP